MRYKSRERRVMSLCAYKLLCFALGRDKVEVTFNTHGKPQIEGLNFNISHTAGLAVVAVADREVGVDAEQIRNFPQKIIKRVFTKNEMEYIKCSPNENVAMFKLWTLKESYVKAKGIGISFPFSCVEFDVSDEMGGKIWCSDFGYEFTQVMNRDYVISVCTQAQICHTRNLTRR